MRRTTNRSGIIVLLIVFVLSVALTACGKENASLSNAPAPSARASEAAAAPAESSLSASEINPDPIEIKIADILTNPVFRVAESKGFFDEYGIDAQIITFATPAEGINSLFIKQADIGFGADFPLLNAVSKGDFSIIAATGTNTDIAAAKWKLFARDEIKTASDLRGKKLSSLRGTFLPYLWDEYLKANGVALDDVEQIGQGGFDEAYVALKKGEIDATWVIGSALVSKFEALEGVHELTDMSKTPVRIGGGIIAPNSLIREHPQGIANFLNALDEASKFIAANPEETADILFKEVKQPKDATIQDLPTNNWTIGFTQQSFDSLTSQKTYMVGAGIIQNEFDLAGKLYLEGLKKALPERVTYVQ